jgi:hypothetical protein
VAATRAKAGTSPAVRGLRTGAGAGLASLSPMDADVDRPSQKLLEVVLTAANRAVPGWLFTRAAYRSARDTRIEPLPATIFCMVWKPTHGAVAVCHRTDRQGCTPEDAMRFSNSAWGSDISVLTLRPPRGRSGVDTN